LSEYRAQDFEKIIGNWVENEGKQKGEIGKDGTQQEKISFAEKPNKKEIEEASEAIKKLVETQPKKLKNLRDLQKIIPEVLSELKNKNNELTRADSLGK
jgi:DNA-binding transcriptional regulator GbsR (MarR family)